MNNNKLCTHHLDCFSSFDLALTPAGLYLYHVTCCHRVRVREGLLVHTPG